MANKTNISHFNGKSAFNWDIYKNRKTALQDLKKNCTLIDLIIETEDGQAYELVHSQVISAFGEKLNKFINENGKFINNYKNKHKWPQNKQVKLIRLPKLTKYTLNILVECAYSGFIRTDLQSGGIWQVLNVADYYQMYEVIKACCAFLIRNLDSSNCVNLYHIGVKYRHSLQRNAWHKIRSNFKHILDKNLTQHIQKEFIKRTTEAAIISQQSLKALNNSSNNNNNSGQLTSTTTTTPLNRTIQEELSTNLNETTNLSTANREFQPEAITTPPSPPPPPITREFAMELEEETNSINENNNLATIRFEHFEPLLMHDKLNIDNEESVWWAIKLWCEFNLIERSKYVTNLLDCIRFPRIKSGLVFSARYIWQDKLILDNREAQKKLSSMDRMHANYLNNKNNSNDNNQPTTSLYGSLRSSLRSASGGGGRSRTTPPAGPATPPTASSSVATSAVRQITIKSLATTAKSTIQPVEQTWNGFRDGFNLPCSINPIQLRPRVPRSILLAIGGWQQGQPTRLIESYDVNCNIWYDCKNRIMTPLAYHGIENINGLLYICGGTDGSEILNELFTFDPIRGNCLQKPSMREPRCYVSTAYLENFLYAMGGHNGSQRMKSVERFDINGSELWNYVQSMNVARSDASACVYRSLIYIAGGLNDMVIESSVEFYNQKDNSWTFIQSMNTPRTSFTLLLYKNSLLAIGGNNGRERLASVEQYDFKTKLWRHHSNLRHKRSTFSAALVDENKLIVVGGYNGQTPFSQVELFEEPSGGSSSGAIGDWIQLQKIRFDRSGLKVVVVNDLPNAIDYTFLGASGPRWI